MRIWSYIPINMRNMNIKHLLSLIWMWHFNISDPLTEKLERHNSQKENINIVG